MTLREQNLTSEQISELLSKFHNYPFSELHAHTHLSNLRMIDSNIKTEDLIQHAYDVGLNGIAITDHEALSSHIKALETHSEIILGKEYDKSRDFKVMLGNEIYLNNTREPQKKYYHFLLIAKDEVGYKQLKKLSTEAWKNSFHDRGLERTITTYQDIIDIVGEDKGHLIASTACIGSFLGASILEFIETGSQSAKSDIDEFISFCLGIFGEDFYIELQAGKSEEQIEYNKIALNISKAYKIKYTITNDVHYLKESEKELHSAYLKSRDGERETELFYNSTFMKTPENMIEWMPYMSLEDIVSGFDSTMEIHSKCETINLFKDIIVPKMELPEFELEGTFAQYYDKYEFIKEMSLSKYSENRYLAYGVEKGFKKKGQEFNDENLSRIDVEFEQLLKISKNLGTNMSSYYNLVDKIVDIIWTVSYVGVARGSVTGFYICYLLEISQLNPIEHDLPWWRHVHNSKVSLADIDLDSEASKRQLIFDLLKDFFGWDRCLNIVTFKTEGSRSSLLTSGRGLGIGHDEVQELADYVKFERGQQWSLSDCWYGNEEKGREPVSGFLEKAQQFPNLIETALKIEGVICGRSIHASGFYIFDDNFIEYNSAMKAPNGQLVTAWNMDDSDKQGGLKVDILTIEALDKIHIAIDLLIEDNVIECKGSIRDTYNEYLHPDVLDYTSEGMWEHLSLGEINSVFQFDTDVGGQGIKKIQPKTLKELAVANSVMRLMATEDGELPIDKYVRYKNFPQQAIDKMDEYNLTQIEKDVISKYLLKNNMLAVEQEDIMELTLDKDISNFSMKESDLLRKIVAKKKTKDIEKMKETYYQFGRETGTSDNMLSYVWNECIGIQLGYSFSRNHTMPYSAIALQEMNLYNTYNPIYWNTAVLTVNASASDESGNNKNTDYGKMAKAIGDMKSRGAVVEFPNINTSKLAFTPDTKDNSILFGLKAINGIGDGVAVNILENRPYTSLNNFIEKATEVKKTAIIKLIKSGAFDLLENLPREQIMKNFLVSINTKESATKVTFATIDNLLFLDLIPDWAKPMLKIYYFHKHINNKKYFFNKAKNKNRYYLPKDSKTMDFFNSNLIHLLDEDVDYEYVDDYIVYTVSNVKKAVDIEIEPLTKWLYSDTLREKYNSLSSDLYFKEDWDKYCKGSISTWEMDSLCYYYHEHELTHLNKELYEIVDFNKLPETPEAFETYWKAGREFRKFQLYRIAGTVLDREKNKHTLSLLTDTGVVKVKFYQGVFTNYDKQISRYDDETGKNEIIEKSWFGRGNMLFIVGYRRDDQFIPRTYVSSIYQHTVMKINNINDDGIVEVKTEREWN